MLPALRELHCVQDPEAPNKLHARPLLAINGEVLERLGTSSRAVYALPGDVDGVQYVAKCDHRKGAGGIQSSCQSALEWTTWHTDLHCSPVRELVAPSSELVMLPWELSKGVMIVNVQRRVLAGDHPDVPYYDERSPVWVAAEETANQIRAVHGVNVKDLGGHQCVWDQDREVYVLVDYGGAWDKRLPHGVRSAYEEVRTTENPQVIGGLDSDGKVVPVEMTAAR